MPRSWSSRAYPPGHTSVLLFPLSSLPMNLLLVWWLYVQTYLNSSDLTMPSWLDFALTLLWPFPFPFCNSEHHLSSFYWRWSKKKFFSLACLVPLPCVCAQRCTVPLTVSMGLEGVPQQVCCAFLTKAPPSWALGSSPFVPALLGFQTSRLYGTMARGNSFCSLQFSSSCCAASHWVVSHLM